METPEQSVIRIEFGGEWWAFEFDGFLRAVDELYSTLALLFVAGELADNAENDINVRMTNLIRIRQLFDVACDDSGSVTAFLTQDQFGFEGDQDIVRPEPLQLLRLTYGSDGEVDFLGFGKLAEALASVINNLISVFREAPDKDLKELEVIDKKVEQAKKAGMSEEECTEYRLRLLAKSDRTLRRFLKDERIKEPVKLLPPPEKVEQRKPPSFYI